MNMQSMVWCRTSPSTLKNSTSTSWVPAVVFQTPRAACTLAITLLWAWSYRFCTSPSRFTPWDTTRCCTAEGIRLSDRGLHMCAWSVQLMPAPSPSTHALNSGRPSTSAGPEKVRQASVNSGPVLATGSRSYCQYASAVVRESFRNRSWQYCTSEPVVASPSVRHPRTLYRILLGMDGTPPLSWKSTWSQKAGWYSM